MRAVWALAAATAVVAAAGASWIAFRSAAAASALTRMAREPLSTESEARALAEVAGLQKVALQTSDGLKLGAWFAPGRRRAAVVLVHGGGANRLQLFPEARMLAQRGYGVLVYDSRACGESDGNLVTWGDGERLDVVAAIDFLSSRPDVDHDRIVLLGHSIGASAVAEAAAHDPRARAVILYATWTSFEDEIKNKFGKYGPLSWTPALWAMRRAGIRPDHIRPIDCIAAIHPRPLLMITGTLDDDTPVAVMERIFAAASEPKELWVVPGAHHGDYFGVAGPEYESRVLRFLESALANGAPAATR